MTITDKIKQLEEKVISFQNNRDHAQKSGEMRKVHYYDNLIQETKMKVKELEKDIPIESNERLREIIDELRTQINTLQIKVEALEEEKRKQTERIDRILNPEKYKPPEPKPAPEEDDMIECPKCGRKYKGVQGLAAHQRWCKQGAM